MNTNIIKVWFLISNVKIHDAAKLFSHSQGSLIYISFYAPGAEYDESGKMQGTKKMQIFIVSVPSTCKQKS